MFPYGLFNGKCKLPADIFPDMKFKFIAIVLLFTCISACQFGRSIIFNFPGINDYKIFPQRDLHAHNKAFHFIPGPSAGAPRPKGLTIKNKEVTFEKYLKDNKTVAFLIIHDDRMVYEQYFSGYDSSSIVPSFSIAKAFTSALIGCAIQDGFIQSVDQHIIDFIPELRKNGFEEVKIKHLLQMTSGLDFDENYADPFSDAAHFYYGTDIRFLCKHLTLNREPGKLFDYSSGSTQLLGLLLERALGNETITHYFDRRLWFPLEMEFDGGWSMEKKKGGIEKTFCCINARARDYAKFGRLYLNNGNWNGKQIVPAQWVKESTTFDASEGGAYDYKYQWWLYAHDPDGAYYAEGHLGQYIYVNPAKKLIIVRLGKNYGDVNWKELFQGYAANVQ